MQPQARNTSIQRVCESMSLRCLLQRLQVTVAYGAMMARALGVGIATSPCCDEVAPMGVVELGTAASQPSSCCDKTWPLSEYQEPAWLDLRVTMLAMGCSGGVGGALLVAYCWVGHTSRGRDPGHATRLPAITHRHPSDRRPHLSNHHSLHYTLHYTVYQTLPHTSP
jgi:hypothetical protein